mgnify:CR=1 FL=1
MERLELNGIHCRIYRYNTVVTGSGAAGFAAANELARLGNASFCMVTEGVGMGTSRNTGSDKQTYYKLSLAGGTPDSVRQMASDLFAGGCMHGDTALCQAAYSAKGFYNLVNLGVPFPSTEYGEYIGYKTDHDDSQRAVSAGPLTSRYMVECLEKKAAEYGLEIFDRRLAVEILTENETVKGLVTFDTNAANLRDAFSVFLCENIIWAAGGPAGLYEDSVYPFSQNGAAGTAFRAGAKGENLTEWQYGIASKGFRWNLSGSYQQVLPRYFSTDGDGAGESDFLTDTMDDSDLLAMTFLKGYQWPFDARKAYKGSSRIDIAVFRETAKGRKVFLDFTQNPLSGRFDFTLLSPECRSYLEQRGALLETPIERLLKLNPKAYEVYKKNGVDLKKSPVEICVAAQHNNGGLAVDKSGATNIKGLFAAGEAAATFGIYRPGGTALNATQADAYRIVRQISQGAGRVHETGLSQEVLEKLGETVGLCQRLIGKEDKSRKFRDRLQSRMSLNGAFIRDGEKIKKALSECRDDMNAFEAESAVSSPRRLPDAMRNRDLITAEFVYLSAMLDYIENGGGSRGSFLVEDGGVPRPVSDAESGVVQQTALRGTRCVFERVPVRPLPQTDETFENLLRDTLHTE